MHNKNIVTCNICLKNNSFNSIIKSSIKVPISKGRSAINVKWGKMVYEKSFKVYFLKLNANRQILLSTGLIPSTERSLGKFQHRTLVQSSD